MKFHLRKRALKSADEVADLLERFVTDRLEYGFEWDDFVSWEHDVLEVEALRQRVAEWEHLLFASYDRPEHIRLLTALAREIRDR